MQGVNNQYNGQHGHSIGHNDKLYGQALPRYRAKLQKGKAQGAGKIALRVELGSLKMYQQKRHNQIE